MNTATRTPKKTRRLTPGTKEYNDYYRAYQERSQRELVGFMRRDGYHKEADRLAARLAQQH